MKLNDDEERNTHRAKAEAAAVGAIGGQRRFRRRALIWAILLLVLVLLIVGLILGLTLFKPKQFKTRITSVVLQGVSPRLSFTPIQVQLNVSLDLEIVVENPNHASFKHGQGEATLLYRGSQVGEAELDPGSIPASGSSTMSCHLVLEVDRFASSSASLQRLFRDILGGQLLIETKTRVPGKITFLGVFHKHAEATSDCQISIGFPAFNVTNQDCRYHTEL